MSFNVFSIIKKNFFTIKNNYFYLFQLAGSDDLDNDIDGLLNEFEDNKISKPLLHTVVFY